MNRTKLFNPKGQELLIIVSAILLINLLLSGGLIYFTMRRDLKSSIMDNDMPLRSALVSSEIRQELQAPIIASSTLGDDLFIRRWLEDGEPDPDFMSRYLDSVRNQHKAMTCFLVSEGSRTYYNMKGAFPIHREDPDAAWYFSFLEGGDLKQLNINYNVDMGGMPTVFINVRIVDDKRETLGVAGIGLELRTIPQLLTKYGTDHDRDIYFIDSEGEIVAKSDQPIISDELILEELKGLPSRAEVAAEPEMRMMECTIEGEAFFLHRTYLPELDWELVTIQHKTVALKRMNRLLITLLSVHIIAIALTLSSVFVSLRHYQSRLRRMATLDPLTGVNNRQVFEYSLTQALHRFERKEIPVSLLLIDIDHFKKINDSYGHLEGDGVLVDTASLIRGMTRKGDEFSRWGGEEFVLLCDNCDLKKAFDLAEKIRKTVKDAALASYPDGGSLSVSIGVSGFVNGDTKDSLFQRVDKALYSAKAGGRNCVRASD